MENKTEYNYNVTEKDIYLFLKAIFKKQKNKLNILSLEEYQQLYPTGKLDPRTRYKEYLIVHRILSEKYILKNDITIGKASPKHKDRNIPVFENYPSITVEGSNFMEYYRKKGSLFAKINNIYALICKILVPLWTAIQIYNYFFPKN